MKKILLKYIILAMAALFMFTGCMEDNEVVGPKPATPPDGNQIPEKDNPTTFIGHYQITDFEAVNPANTLDIMTLQGIFNMDYNAQSQQLAGTFALEYAGYNAATENLQRQLDAQLSDLSNITLYDAAKAEPYYITFNSPLELTIGNEIYKIKNMKKLGDTLYDIETVTLDDVSNLVRLCDPAVADKSDMDCSTPTGAMKYIGYYRVEEITCGGKTYKGGSNTFAGEMTAHAYLSSVVNIPISVKFQIAKENTELSNCLFGSVDANPSLLFYYSSTYQVPLSAANILSETFASLGLNGIKNSDNEIVRTTMINYLPKNNNPVSDDNGNPILNGNGTYTFPDMLFNNNNIELKLKVQQQWQLGNINTIQKILTDTPYINQ